MTATYINILPEILDWVIKKVSLHTTDTSVLDLLEKWRSGEKRPTFDKVEKISRKIQIPFGYFFLAKPPKEKIDILEFRTVDSQNLTEPSRNLIDTLDAMKDVQEWMRSYIRDSDADEISFVGRYKDKYDVSAIVSDIRRELGLEEDWFNKYRNREESFVFLRKLIEKKGILVMMNGIVGSNTRRKLNVNEFRAFTLIDKYAPLIFINAADSSSGRIFSLVHELAHIWIGLDSLFNEQKGSFFTVKPAEQLCNAVAAELLVPNDIFIRKWQNMDDDSFIKIKHLAEYFKCSAFVIVRRALDDKYINKAQYNDTVNFLMKEYSSRMIADKQKKKSGGNYYNTMSSRLTHNFLIALDNSIKQGRTQYTEAYRLTNTNRKTYAKLINKIGGVNV